MNWAAIGAIIFVLAVTGAGFPGLFWGVVYVVALIAAIAICAMVFVKDEEVTGKK